MLWTIAVVLAVLWLLGLVSSYTMGGFVHILLVLAVVVVLINILPGRRPVGGCGAAVGRAHEWPTAGRTLRR